jgi:hypothetical protein
VLKVAVNCAPTCGHAGDDENGDREASKALFELPPFCSIVADKEEGANGRGIRDE